MVLHFTWHRTGFTLLLHIVSIGVCCASLTVKHLSSEHQCSENTNACRHVQGYAYPNTLPSVGLTVQLVTMLTCIKTCQHFHKICLSFQHRSPGTCLLLLSLQQGSAGISESLQDTCKKESHKTLLKNISDTKHYICMKRLKWPRSLFLHLLLLYVAPQYSVMHIGCSESNASSSGNAYIAVVWLSSGTGGQHSADNKCVWKEVFTMHTWRVCALGRETESSSDLQDPGCLYCLKLHLQKANGESCFQTASHDFALLLCY